MDIPIAYLENFFHFIFVIVQKMSAIRLLRMRTKPAIHDIYQNAAIIPIEAITMPLVPEMSITVTFSTKLPNITLHMR